VVRLGQGEWFTSKTSACGLVTLAHKKASHDSKEKISSIFKTLCNDETPIVRKVACSNFGGFVKVLGKEAAKDFYNVFQKFAKDTQDTVRLLAIEACVSLGGLYSIEENKEKFLPTIRSLTSDKSWRVRYMVAEQFSNICTILGEELTKTEMMGTYIRLLKDSEAEVRTAAAKNVSEFGKKAPLELFVKQVLPCIEEIVDDKNKHVRAQLAAVVMNLAPSFGKENTIKYLLDLFMRLLKDEVPEVRLNVISKLEGVNSVIGVDLLSQNLLPAVVELA